jgi:plastocyanin
VKRPLLTAIVVGALAYASVASAAPTEILVKDNVFDPDIAPTRNLATGTSFHWQDAANNGHNVRQDFALFNSGSLTTSVNFSIRASAGTYHYYCTLHGSPAPNGGPMDGVVKVRPIFAAAPTGLPFTVSWALSGTSATATNTGNQFDVRYRVGTSTTWTLWRNNTTARSGVFGQSGQPVQVISGRTYHFQARSQKMSAPNQQSGWSPTLSVTAT